MSYTLLFKTKNHESLFSVISDIRADLMTFDDQLEKINYSSDTLLEDGQCYQIENFNEKSYCPNFLRGTFATAEYSRWNSSQTDILFSLKTDGNKFYFQKFVKSQLLTKSWLLLSGEPTLKDEKIITFNPYATAFYDKETDVLLFRKLDDLKKIFPGIEDLYREATEQEVSSFLNNDLFNTQNYNKERLGILNRKRIALAIENLSNISDKKAFCNNLKEYCADISIENENTVVINTENDLKNVLYALDERFYTTDRSSEKRLANSIIKIRS